MGKRKKRIIRKTLQIVFAVFAAIFAMSTFTWLCFRVKDNGDQQTFEELRAEVAANLAAASASVSSPTPIGAEENADAAPTPVPTMLPQYGALHEKNQDCVGWLSIEDTAIDFPVMYTPEEPNYYLRRLFNGESSSAGVPYVAEGCTVFPLSDTVIIYGHNRRNGSMFADLEKYKKAEFCRAHPLIRFDTLYAEGSYEVFAAFRTVADKKHPEKGFAYYNDLSFPNEAAFNAYVSKIIELGMYDTGIVPTYGDQLLLLSTCGYQEDNGRFVVAARRIG